MQNRSKAEYLAYREHAKEALIYIGRDVEYVLSVPNFASVQMVEDGAFVELTVFIPRDKIDIVIPKEEESK